MYETKVLVKEAPVRKNKFFIIVIALLALLVIAAAGAAFYYFKKLQDLKTVQPQTKLEDTQSLLARVGELMVLPTDEQPTVATVADTSQLADQPFFARAKKGDKVLIYTKAQKAILYDPVAHKIVEVAPINSGDAAGVTSETPPSAEENK